MAIFLSVSFLISVCLFSERNYRNVRFVVRFLAESNYAVHQGIQRMVFTHTYIQTRVVHGTSLANQDVTGFGSLSTKQFNSQSFAM